MRLFVFPFESFSCYSGLFMVFVIFGLSLVLIVTLSSAWEGASLPWTVGVVNTPYTPRTPRFAANDWAESGAWLQGYALGPPTHMAFGVPSKRKLWSMESMKETLDFVEGGGGLREAARTYNVPVETLRRRVTGAVSIDCRPGPGTVLTKEEDAVVKYLISMCDMA